MLRERLFENLPYPERGVRHELRSYDYYLGVLALKDKRLNEAITHFQRALRHLPPSSGLDLYEDCLANAYLESGRPDEAITEYLRILRTNPNYPLAQYHLAEAYERKGEREQAQVGVRGHRTQDVRADDACELAVVAEPLERIHLNSPLSLISSLLTNTCL